MFKFHCPHCNQRIEAEDFHAGQKVDCPACSEAFTVPFPDKAPPPRPTEILPPENEEVQWHQWKPISAWSKLPNSAGIYEIKNSTSGLSYIGSAKALKKRGHYQSLSTDYSHSEILQQAFNSDGEESFQFRILEFCDEDKRIEREQKYMDERDFNTLYNAAPRAGTIRGYVLTPAQMEKRSEARRGVPLSEDVKRGIWLKGVEREFKKELYAKLFKDFKKTDKYQSLVKEIKDYANAAPNRRKPVAWELDDGDFNMGTDLQTWWAFGGGREYVDEKFEFTKCDWKYIGPSNARWYKDELHDGCGNSKLYKLIAESIFHREVRETIKAAFEDAVETGEVSLEYKPYVEKEWKDVDRIISETTEEIGSDIGWRRLCNYLGKMLGVLRSLYDKRREEEEMTIHGMPDFEKQRSLAVPDEGWTKILDLKAHYYVRLEDKSYKALCGREELNHGHYIDWFCHVAPAIEDRCKTCEKKMLQRGNS